MIVGDDAIQAHRERRTDADQRRTLR